MSAVSSLLEGREVMTKPIDPDLKALRGAVRALEGSSSLRMLRVNMDFLWDRFVDHPPRHLEAALAGAREQDTG